MPLLKGKSQKAFSHNVKAEMDAGKPMKQSLAIAYSTKRKSKKMNKGGDCYSEGGEVQDDVNKTYERDSVDHDSMSDSTHFGKNVDETIKSVPLEEYKSIKKDYPGYWAEGGEIPGEEGKAMRSHSDLGSHVEMLVDRMLEMKFGNKEAEHFSSGGGIGYDNDETRDFQKGVGYRIAEPESSMRPGLSKEEGMKWDEEHKVVSNPKSFIPAKEGPPGFAKGGRIEEMVDRHMAKKMASGGQIVEDNRAHDDEMGQSDEPWENDSQWKDTDLFSQDQHMNADMDHEDSMEPNKKKKLMSSILESVRNRNMGR